MKTIVASRNPDLGHDFSVELMRRSDVRLVTVDTAAELLAELRQGAALCLLDRMLPDGEAGEILDTIRADKHLAKLPVVLMTSHGAPPPNVSTARTLGFTEAVELPAAPGTLPLMVARLLGVPLRDHDRRAVHLHVYALGADGQDEPQCLGTSIDISELGMLIQLAENRAVALGTSLWLRFVPPGQVEQLDLHATAVRLDTHAAQPARALAVAFTDVPPGPRAVLHRFIADLVHGWPLRWKIERDGARQLVALAGIISAHSDLAPLFSLRRPVDFRLRDLRRIAPEAVVRWRQLMSHHAGTDPQGVRLYECSVSFILQANILPTLLEHAVVESFYLPYTCGSCGLDDERLVERSQLGQALAPPDFGCLACGSPLCFDDIPERYFAFLTAS